MSFIWFSPFNHLEFGCCTYNGCNRVLFSITLWRTMAAFFYIFFLSNTQLAWQPSSFNWLQKLGKKNTIYVSWKHTLPMQTPPLLFPISNCLCVGVFQIFLRNSETNFHCHFQIIFDFTCGEEYSFKVTAS